MAKKTKKALKKRAKKIKKTKNRRARKSGRARKKTRLPAQELFNEQAVGDLLSRGKQRGFITETEILHFFPNIEQDIEGLEELYRKLEAANIKITESGGLIESVPPVEAEAVPLKDKDI